MALLNEKLKMITCSDFRIFLKKMIKDNLGIRKSDIINRRMFIIGAAKIIIFTGIVARLFSLQINENKK